MLPETPVSFVSVWMLGLALGLTACTVTCLPFMGTWALGRQGDRRTLFLDTGSFLAGRLAAYTTLGAVAGWGGLGLTRWLAGGVGNLVIGLMALLAAVWLIWPTGRSGHSPCRTARRAALMPPFLLGVSLTLIPCAPLTTLLATCAATASPLTGAAYGICFGAGAVISPLLVLIPACGGLGMVLREQAGWLLPGLRYGAALMMLLLAARRFALLGDAIMLGLPTVAVLLLCWRYARLRSRISRPRLIPVRAV